jgi:hypothetical protein
MVCAICNSLSYIVASPFMALCPDRLGRPLRHLPDLLI